MFKKILLPTDGSKLAEAGVLKGLQFARALGAQVIALHVSPEFHVLTYRTDMLEDTRDEYERDSRLHAEAALAFVAKAAAEHGVDCQGMRRVSDDVYRAIIDVAREIGCDAIAMASHGRRGVAGMLLGSQTLHVLTHSTIPVLVWR